MIARERISIFLQNEKLDKVPWIAWIQNENVDIEEFNNRWNPDVVILPNITCLNKCKTENGPVMIVEIKNAVWEAIEDSPDFINNLRLNPAETIERVQMLNHKVRSNMLSALDLGADGIFYRLGGASPEWCTPMQYGGHFMSLDETNLESVSDAFFNVLYVDGKKGVYLDFAHDLGANVFAWDECASEVSANEVNIMHSGPIAVSTFPLSDSLKTMILLDIDFMSDGEKYEQMVAVRNG